MGKTKKLTLFIISILFIGFMLFIVPKFKMSSSGTMKSTSNIEQAFSDTSFTSSDKFQYTENVQDSMKNESEVAADGEKVKSDVSEPRMVVYKAEMKLEVKDFKKIEKQVEQMVNQMSGYIIQQNSFNLDEHHMQGEMQIRIPRKSFDAFLEKVEGMDVTVQNKNVSGHDVTEEYVDQESRLKSKRVQEERLIAFMKEAINTQDLMQISTTLTQVQEDIEVIIGRMNFLENQAELSTIQLTFSEKKIVVPALEKKELNTWEKTKQSFMESINGLVVFASSLFIFFAGKSPIIITYIVVFGTLWFLFRKRIKKWFQK